ncbi:MAG: bifunctional phosphopantothenoylcysteine decarboxylase/phosphopantothenate--cysteine ligase CoaBC [Balneolaceae bacterium]
MLSGKRILLGVTGGIAAYKAVFLLREFQKAGAEVRVTMTPSATRFVGTDTFSSLSRNPVAVDVFNQDSPDTDWTRHIHWGEWADLFVIAPCTANTLAKITGGQADNMLTSTVLAARCPLLICPTMDGEMYENAAVRGNLEKAETMGYHILEPDSGYLASGLESIGRLPEADTILNKAASIIDERRKNGPLRGKKIAVTAGPTREFFDPVRFLSNPSSGKMGIAMADAAARLGGDVVLLRGPVSAEPEERMSIQSFVSTDELHRLVQQHAEADIIIMAAAVSDYKPASTADQKIKKTDESNTIELVRTPDILQELGKQKRDGQHLIGFAMETDNHEANARKKLDQKNLDWICLNPLAETGAGFESDTNRITLINKNESKEFVGEKREIAMQILYHICETLGLE